jgi:CheY-specific phosphatase CheX
MEEIDKNRSGDAGARDGEPTTLDEIARACTKELLEAYGVAARPAEDAGNLGASLGFAGIIGFTGPVLRGTLLIATTNTALERSNPAPTSPTREWMAELANQLLGRIKNQLLACEVEIHLTTPLVLRGQHLSIEALRKVSPIEMITDEGPILVVLETESAGTLELVRRRDIQVGSEGDCLMWQ